jgi:hypothetical protein
MLPGGTADAMVVISDAFVQRVNERLNREPEFDQSEPRC